MGSSCEISVRAVATIATILITFLLSKLCVDVHAEIILLPTGIGGGKIAVTGYRGKESDIYILDLVRHEISARIASPGRDEHPVWSPDGSLIAFHSDRDGGDLELYVARSDGSNVRRVTHRVGEDCNPTFTPDGRTIIFRRALGKRKNLFAINVDGSGLRQLTRGRFIDSNPRVSPDGKELLFSSSASWPGWDIYHLDLLTRERRRKTDGEGTFCRPAWRPDGRAFAYSHGKGSGINLWLELASGRREQITHFAGKDYDPEWRDERSLFFVRNGGGTSEHYSLYLLELDSGRITRITEGDVSVRDPAWLPSAPNK